MAVIFNFIPLQNTNSELINSINVTFDEQIIEDDLFITEVQKVLGADYTIKVENEKLTIESTVRNLGLPQEAVRSFIDIAKKHNKTNAYSDVYYDLAKHFKNFKVNISKLKSVSELKQLYKNFEKEFSKIIEDYRNHITSKVDKNAFDDEIKRLKLSISNYYLILFNFYQNLLLKKISDNSNPEKKKAMQAAMQLYVQNNNMLNTSVRVMFQMYASSMMQMNIAPKESTHELINTAFLTFSEIINKDAAVVKELLTTIQETKVLEAKIINDNTIMIKNKDIDKGIPSELVAKILACCEKLKTIYEKDIYDLYLQSSVLYKKIDDDIVNRNFPSTKKELKNRYDQFQKEFNKINDNFIQIIKYLTPDMENTLSFAVQTILKQHLAVFAREALENLSIYEALADSHFTESEKRDYEAIDKRLEDTSMLNKHFMILSAELQKRLEKKSTGLNQKGLNQKYYHVLTEYMNEWSTKNGFNQAQTVFCIREDKHGNEERIEVNLPAKAPVIFDFLEPDVFNGFILALGYIAKDIGAGVSHGEFSHFLLEYVLDEENKANPFLQNLFNKLVKSSAEAAYLDSEMNTSAWERVFDKDPVRGTYGDPDFLHADLIGIRDDKAFEKNAAAKLDIKSFETLSTMIKNRANKRNDEFIAKPTSFFKPVLDSDIQSKYRNKKGLVINDAIYFDTGDNKNIHVIYDDIKYELFLYRRILKDKGIALDEVSLPNLAFTAQLEMCLNPNNYKHLEKGIFESLKSSLTSVHSNFKEMLANASEQSILRHRDVILSLQPLLKKIFSTDDPANKYLAAIVTHALDKIEKLDMDVENKPTPLSKKF